MNAQQLKNSILQEAIEGRLVPQDPNDEPASVLLERIREEKKRLFKEGKLKKKDLEETPISEDEKPFEIPDSWEWCRIGTIFEHSSGKQQSSNNKKVGTLQKYITTSNLYWDKFLLDTLKEMYFSDEELKTCSATKGDLLVCEGGAGYGRSAIWSFDYDICLQNHVHRLRPYVSGICRYVYYLIYLLKESNRLVSVGTAMPGLSANRLKEIMVPVPPLAEQKRIVAKIEELLPKVEEFGKAQDALNKLNEELPDRLKKSILQEAITGRLVPQDPNDEPASVLLDKIRAEKKQLVKEGKLKKKDLEETPISEDEKPFEIPESWEWVRLSSISKTITKGTTPRGGKVAYSAAGIGFLRAENVVGFDKLDLSSMKYVTDEEHKGFLSRSILEANDLLITIAGTLGRTALVRECDLPLNANQAVSLVRLVNAKTLSLLYVIYVLNAPSVQIILTNQKKVTAIPNLTLEIIGDCIIPLPPYAEQLRIVAKIEELFAVLDSIKESLEV